MRILIIANFFPPLNSIASLRPYSWAKYWTEAGHSVTVLTTEKKIDPAVTLNLPNNGFDVIEIPMPNFINSLKDNYKASSSKQAPHQPNSTHFLTKAKKYLIKMFHYFRYSKGIFNSCRMPDFSDLWIRPALKAVYQKEKFDLVVSSAGPYSVHIIAASIKKKGFAKKWIADYRDSWTNNHIYPGMFPFTKIEKSLEKKLLCHADAITTVSEPLTHDLKVNHGNKVFVVENGFDPSDLEELSPENMFPNDGKYRIVNTGSLYFGKQDPTPLFRSINAISNDPLHCHLLDSLEVLFVGPNQANLEEMIAYYNVGNWVKMAGFINRPDALRMQRDAHALLFLAWNDPSVDGVLSGKLFEYLFSGTPILSIGSPQLEASQKLILEAKAGQAFFSDNDLKQFLIQQLNRKAKVNCAIDRIVLQSYTRKNLALKLIHLVN